jgi:hypothetical protein
MCNRNASSYKNRIPKEESERILFIRFFFFNETSRMVSTFSMLDYIRPG